MDEVVYHKINYQGSSKVIKRLCEENGNLVDYKADKSEIPVNTSDLYNDSGFITNLVDNLANYYLKSETYTQAEVNSLIGAISTLHIEVVQTLPTEDISTNTIYLVPKQTAGQNDTYDEYIYVNNHWEHIGSTDIDLTNYYTKTETDTLLDGKVDKVTGKGLSTEDYTTAEKTKLSGIETGAQVNVKPDWDAAAGADDEILNKPSLATVATTGDYDDLTNKPQNLVQDANYVHTDNNYTTAEKTKLAGIEAGAQVNVEPLIGTTLNTTPSQVLNAIQNGVPVSITHTDATYGAGTVTSFYYSAVNNAVIGSTVAKVYNSGQFVGYLLFELMGHTTANTWTMYNTMLAEKTDIPDELADLGDDPTHRLVTDAEKAAWDAKSDFSGSYNDLTDKPTIPDELADLQDDATHRLVTDTEKTMWNGKSVVTANPASTTESLASIEIDGVGYSISGGGGSVNAWLNTGGTNLNPASDNLIDLNDYTTPGVYYCSDNSKSQYVSNRPTNNVQVFTLVVQKVGSAVSNWRQIYYEAGATPRMYYRAKNGSSSSWQEWKSEALSSDIPTSWKLTHDTTLIDATSSNPVDLNDIATPGTYHANDGNVAYISNKPALATQTKRFLLVVQNISNTANAYQIYMEGSQSRWFIRNTTNYGSTWSAWAQIAYADKMWRLAEGTQLNATSESRLDLNTIDAAGTYYTPNETSGPYIDHKPVESNNRFTLIVQALGNADSNRVRQIYQSIGTHDIYERYRNGTSANWSSWRRFVYDNEISQPLIGTTATVTPSQVLDALQAGRPIYIAYTETESGANVTLGYSDFTYIDLTGNIYSTLLTSSQGHPVMMALTGNVSTNTWSGYTAVLAEQSDIPDELADLDDDSTHRLVTDTEKSAWNAKSDFSGSYNDLTNKPTNATASADGFMSSTDFKKINAQAIAANTDLNTITNVGWYYTTQGSTLTNAPQTGNYAAMLVYYSGASSRRVQVFFSGSTYTYAYTRLQTSSSAWTTWERIAFASDLPTKLSDLTDDVVSGNYVKLSDNDIQAIINTQTTTSAALAVKSMHTGGYTTIQFLDKNGTALGFIGVSPSKKPVFYDTAWREIALKADIPTVGTAAAKNTGDFVERLSAWLSQETHNIDDAEVGVRFVYTTHGAPTNGTLFTVGGKNYENYRWQILIGYGGNVNSVYVRKRNGDNSTWSSWGRLVTENDGSYLKTSAGAWQMVEDTATSGEYVSVVFKSNAPTKKSVIGVRNADNATRYIGMEANGRPIWTDTTDHPLVTSEYFDFLFNATTSQKWYSFCRKALASHTTGSYIINISAVRYSYTPGTNLSFILNSSYGRFTIAPISSSIADVSWIPQIRVSHDETYLYVEILCTSLSGSQANYFRVTITPITWLAADIEFYAPTQSVATAVDLTYATNASVFRCAKADEIIYKTYNGTQQLTNASTGTSVVLTLKSSYPNAGANQALIGFFNDTDTLLGYLGVKDYKPYFLSNGGVYSELAFKSDIPSTATFLAKSGGQMTGAITFAQGSIVQQTANTMPFFLGIDAFASGGAMKWQTTAGVVNALNSGASGLVKKTTNIQSGSVSISNGSAVTVTFPTAFAGIPTVAIAQTTTGTNNTNYIVSVSKTQVQFKTGYSGTSTIYWIAYYAG